MVKNPINDWDNHHPWWLAGFWDPSTVSAAKLVLKGGDFFPFLGKGPVLVGRIFYVGFRFSASGGDLKITPSN